MWAALRRLTTFARRTGTPRDERHRVGRSGEAAAARRLRRTGFRVLRRNLRTPFGEVDLLCRERATGICVIVEVKTSAASDPLVRGGGRLRRDQRERLLRVARYLRQRRGERAVRIDLVTVDLDGAGDAAVWHERGAVSR